MLINKWMFLHPHYLFVVAAVSGSTEFGTSCLQFHTCHCTKFSIKDFFSKCDQTADLFTFTEEVLDGKLHFLCSVCMALSCILMLKE